MNSQLRRPKAPGSDLVLDVVVVDRHSAVQQDPRQPLPVVQAVVDVRVHGVALPVPGEAIRLWKSPASPGAVRSMSAGGRALAVPGPSGAWVALSDRQCRAPASPRHQCLPPLLEACVPVIDPLNPRQLVIQAHLRNMALRGFQWDSSLDCRTESWWR